MVYSLAHRESIGWDKQLEGGLPDCRLTGGNRDATAITRYGMSWQRVFCASCGRPAGLCTEWTPHVFYVCDQPECLATAPVTAIEVPPPPGTIPEAAIKG